MCARWERGTVRTRTGKDFVLLCVHLVGALSNGCLYTEPAQSTMKLRHVLRNQITLGVVPGTCPDSVPSVDGRRVVCRFRAQISAPRVVACTLSLRQSLAVCIGSRQTTEVSAFAESLAGNEKTRH